jgi:O-antigen ligase
VVAVVQRAVSPNLVYGFWTPVNAGASPIGPVVNRNQFAGWLLMALPLTVGYLVAHLEAYRPSRRQPWRVRLRKTLHARTLLLAACGTLMALAILVSRSRSAIVGLVVAVSVGWMAAGWRRSRGGRWAVPVVALLFGAAALTWLDLGSLADRFNQVDSGMAGRMTIWRDTLSVAGRFRLTGVGLGGYQAAMAVYQTSTRDVLFNHAHSQYLQMATEGGLLLTVPALVALTALVVGARARLAADRSPMWSIRVGAAAGLVAVAVQSVWESVLRMPANGVLMAVAAAILLHRAPETPRE